MIIGRVVAWILMIHIQLSQGFPTETLTGSDAHTKNHKAISDPGIRKAIGQFILQKNISRDISTDPYGVVFKFFGTDNDGMEQFNNRKKDIINYVNKQEQEQAINAFVHCNGEEIEEAHAYIIRLRKQIIQLGRNTYNPDLELIRENIGKCLYTIQEFYSATNWVEMYGKVPYRDFGVPNKNLMAIAGKSVDTCSNCDNSGNNPSSCKNNLLIRDMLTSGYKSGQKPQLYYKTGKCGHGGILDTNNGEKTATGGINKDRLQAKYSPHHHLHNDAFFAAREATSDFFTNPEFGLFSDLSDYIVAKIFGLLTRYRASVGFAIDVTGSMGDDIAAVKKASEEIVSTVMDTNNAPIDYVLSTFSDPESLTQHVLTTEKPFTMIKTIDDLFVADGDDCPEYALSGLLACIEACREHSRIFLFTDATAKDFDRNEEVIQAAVAKDIEIWHVLTGTCGLRKRREASRYKREANGLSVYYDIAKATDGGVYRVSVSDIPDVMKEIAEISFPSSTAIVDVYSILSADNDTVFFPVDSTMKNVKIKIIGPFSTSDIDVASPLGSLIDSVNTTVLFEAPNKVIVVVVNPTPGIYSITRKINTDWNVNITAQTAVDFDFIVFEERENGSYNSLAGNPILGKKHAIFVNLYNLPRNASVSSIILTNDHQVFDLPAKHIESDVDTTYYAEALFSLESYQVSVKGTDEYSNEWKRTSAVMINAVHIKLSMVSIPDLYVDTTANISYMLENLGEQNKTLIVSIADNRGLLNNQTEALYNLSSGESTAVLFEINGSFLYETVTYTITVQEYENKTVIQRNTRTIYINKEIPPKCTISVLEEDCSTLVDKSCADVQWNAEATIEYITELYYISGSNGLHIEHSNLESSPVVVNVQGTCCMTSAYVTVIDKNSNFARCNFYLDERSDESTAPLSTTEKIAIGVVAGIVIASLLVASVIIILLHRGVVKPKLDAMKVENFNMNAVKDLPTQKEKSSKIVFQENVGNVPPKDTSLPGYNKFY